MISGQTIVIKGDIEGQEDLVIAGRVEGTIKLPGRVLKLAEGSHVVGTITAGGVIASGKIEGTVEATQRVEILATAVVEGDLTTPILIVADGCEVRARVDMPAASKLKVA